MSTLWTIKKDKITINRNREQQERVILIFLFFLFLFLLFFFFFFFFFFIRFFFHQVGEGIHEFNKPSKQGERHMSCSLLTVGRSFQQKSEQLD